MDHGLLNVPLAKRGDIDKQIDAYKAKQAADEKAARRLPAAQAKADKAKALELLESATDERLDHLAVRCGKTRAAMRKHLRGECHWQPKLVISLLQ